MNFSIWRKLWPQKRNYTQHAAGTRDRTRFRPWVLQLEDRFAPSVSPLAQLLPALPDHAAPQAVVQLSTHTTGAENNVGQQVSDQVKTLQAARPEDGSAQGIGSQVSTFVLNLVPNGNDNSDNSHSSGIGEQVSVYVQVLHQQRANGEFTGGLGLRIVIFVHNLKTDDSGSSDQTGNGNTSTTIPTNDTTSTGGQVSATVHQLQQQRADDKSESGLGSQVSAFVHSITSDNAASDSTGTSRVLTVSLDASGNAASARGQQISDYVHGLQVDGHGAIGQNVRNFVQGQSPPSDKDDARPDQDNPPADRPDNLGTQVSEHVQGLLTAGYQSLGQDLRNFVQNLPGHPLSSTSPAATIEEPGVTFPVLGAAVDSTEQSTSMEEPSTDGLIQSLLGSSFAMAGLLWQLKVSNEHKRPRKNGIPNNQ